MPLFASIKQLGKHSVLYGLGGMAQPLVGFVLLPIYTRYLTPADYGILSLLLVPQAIVTTVSQVGLGQALFYEVAYRKSDERQTVSTLTLFVCLECLFLFALLFFGAPLLSRLLFRSADYARLLRFIFGIGLLAAPELLALSWLRMRDRSGIYAGLALASVFVAAALNIVFVVVLRRGVEGLVTAGLIRAGLFSIPHGLILARHLGWTFSGGLLARSLRYGAPLVPANLSSQAMTWADRLFLQRWRSTDEVGIYSLGYKIGYLMELAVQSIQLAWPTRMFAIAKEPDATGHFSRMITYYVLAVLYLGLGLSVLAREAVWILTAPAFHEAHVVVPLVVFSYALYGVRHMTSVGIYTTGKTVFVTHAVVACALLNLGLNCLLVRPYGMLGAAWATLISYAALFVFQTALSQRLWHIPFESARLTKIAAACALIYAASLAVPRWNPFACIAVKGALLAAYPLLLGLMRFFTAEERAAFRRLSAPNRRAPS